MLAHLLERPLQRREVSLVQVLDEVLADAAAMHGACGLQRLEAFGRDEHEDHAPIVRRAVAPNEPFLLHPVDHPGQAALARQDPLGELGHPARAAGLLELDEDVVPAQNTGTETARLVLTLTPSGIERWFEAILERAPNDITAEDVPDNVEEVAARYVATASSYGIEFV